MSRKDYRIIAAAIAERVAQAESMADRSPWRVTAMQEIASTLADRLKHDNPNFKRQTFLNACGL